MEWRYEFAGGRSDGKVGGSNIAPARRVLHIKLFEICQSLLEICRIVCLNRRIAASIVAAPPEPLACALVLRWTAIKCRCQSKLSSRHQQPGTYCIALPVKMYAHNFSNTRPLRSLSSNDPSSHCCIRS